MNIRYKIKDFKRSIKWACQRLIRGYDDRALWDIDYWFRDTIVPMLEWHRDNRCYILRNPDANENYSHDEANKVFDEMIYLIKYSDPDKLLKEWGKEYNFTHEEFERAGYMAEQNKNKFFELFSKYFYQLWD